MASGFDSLDNASNFTSHHDKKKLKEMRKELILIFRFFCLDKNLIVELLKGPGGGVSKEGKARFPEPHVYEMLSQVLSSV